MIVSVHRLTGYWLEPEPELARKGERSSWLASRVFLDLVRSPRIPTVPIKGQIYKYYDPEALPTESPGYRWLRKRLGELNAPDFDAVPEFDPQAPVPDRDPFPAFYWQMEAEDGRPSGLLEVLVGWDTVVFHQSATCAARAGEGEEALYRLMETGWAGEHHCSEALFTARFVQVSHLEAADREVWSKEMDACEHSSHPFVFPGREVEYEMRLGIGHTRSQGRDDYSGLVLVGEAVERTTHAVAGEDFEQLHLDAGGFIVRLATLLANASKIAWEHNWAQSQHRLLGEGLGAHRDELERLQRDREQTLPAPLSRGEFERLQHIYHAAHKDLDHLHQAAQTCRLNLRQFEGFSRQLLDVKDRWADNTRLKLRRLVDELHEAQLTLQARAQWLQDEIHLLLATGGRFVGSYVPELLRPGLRSAGSRPAPQGLQPLVVDAPTDEVFPPAPTTLWFAGGEGPPAEQQGPPRPLVLRPGRITPDRREDLIELYSEALGDCSPEDLRRLIKTLCHPQGRLRLSTAGSGRSWLAVGKVFARTADVEELQEAQGEILRFLELCAQEPARTSARVDPDEPGLLSLLFFLEAVTRFLVRPAHHLAGVAGELAAERPRLLFLIGFLQSIAGQEDAARGFLRQAARSALAGQDFSWAYFVAQFSREHERRRQEARAQRKASDPDSRPDQPQKRPWLELASDFLDAYDLRSAVGLARKTRSAGRGRQPFSRPWGIRAGLWTLAVLVGAALLAADRWLGSVPAPWQGSVLSLVGALAVVAAPGALALGARGALTVLFPGVLYPRILGAVTLATITFCATEETSFLTSGRPSIIAALMLLCAGGGFLYLYFEVRKKVQAVRESLLRCLDVFSLAFLEAVSLSAIFVFVYEEMFRRALVAPETAAPFTLGDVFLRPRTIVLVALLSMLVGIVVQLLIEPASRPGEDGRGRAEPDLFPRLPGSHG